MDRNPLLDSLIQNHEFKMYPVGRSLSRYRGRSGAHVFITQPNKKTLCMYIEYIIVYACNIRIYYNTRYRVSHKARCSLMHLLALARYKKLIACRRSLSPEVMGAIQNGE